MGDKDNTQSEDIPADLQAYLAARDGAKDLVQLLPQRFSPEQIENPSREQRVWELLGLFYFNQQPKRRSFEALSIFSALYAHMLTAQSTSQRWVHKAMPLLWMAECLGDSGFVALRKRYLMLALCDDAIRDDGKIDVDNSGVYFRLVWRLGMDDAMLRHYAAEAKRIANSDPLRARFPEWVLQQLGQDWLTEFPSPAEANQYLLNPRYVEFLAANLGRDQGRSLEELAEYLMMCMPGCRTSRRKRSQSTEYDIVCSMEGFDVDFRSELGRYFACECKDWSEPASFTVLAKFCRVLDSVKSKFGILFSRDGISGSGGLRDAGREQQKVFQDRGMVIVVIDKQDLRSVQEGTNFINLLRHRYERVRLDLSGQ